MAPVIHLNVVHYNDLNNDGILVPEPVVPLAGEA